MWKFLVCSECCGLGEDPSWKPHGFLPVPFGPWCNLEVWLFGFEWEFIQIWKSNKSFRLLNHVKKTEDKGLLTALAVTSLVRAVSKVNTDWKHPALSACCLLHSWWTIPPISSLFTKRWLADFSLPLCSSSALRRKQEEVEAWVMAWVTGLQGNLPAQPAAIQFLQPTRSQTMGTQSLGTHISTYHTLCCFCRAQILTVVSLDWGCFLLQLHPAILAQINKTG